MNAKKCQYMLIGRNHQLKQKELNLKLFSDYTPKTNYIKFLGITLDPRVYFHKCMEEIIKKCNRRLNILKILANKAWKLKEETITAIYFSLVRSIIDYNYIIYPLLSKTN